MSKKPTFCVFCGSRPGRSPQYEATARALGDAIARHGCDLVFGGGNGGLMGIVSQTALEGGASVTGVIPTFLLEREAPAGNLTKLEHCGSFAERKARMAELSDGFFVLPGGIGTLEEAFEVLTNLSIERTRKPIGFVSTGGYYAPLFRMLETAQQEGFLGEGALSHVRVHEDPETLLKELLELLGR